MRPVFIPHLRSIFLAIQGPQHQTKSLSLSAPNLMLFSRYTSTQLLIPTDGEVVEDSEPEREAKRRSKSKSSSQPKKRSQPKPIDVIELSSDDSAPSYPKEPAPKARSIIDITGISLYFVCFTQSLKDALDSSDVAPEFASNHEQAVLGNTAKSSQLVTPSRRDTERNPAKPGTPGTFSPYFYYPFNS